MTAGRTSLLVAGLALSAATVWGVPPQQNLAASPPPSLAASQPQDPAASQQQDPAATRLSRGGLLARPLPGAAPTIAAGKTVVVAWAERRSTATRVLALTADDAAPRPLGPPLRRGGRGRAVDSAPASTVAPDGSIWIAASRHSGTAQRLWLQRYAADGWEAALAGPFGRQYDRHPAVAAGDGDSLWITWIGADDGNPRAAGLFASRYDGRRWGPVETVPRASGRPMAPSLTVDRSGRPVVVWAAGHGQAAEIWWSARRAGRWSAPRRLSRNNVPDVVPTIAVAGGSVTVSWLSYTGSGYLPVARTGSSVASLGPEVPLSAEPGGRPVIVAGRRGPVAFWRHLDADGTGGTIRGRAFRAGAWDVAHSYVAAGPSFAVASAPNGRLMLTWIRADGSLGVHADAAALAGAVSAEAAPGTPDPAAVPDLGIGVPELFTAFGDSITNGVVYDPDRRTSPGYQGPLQKALRGFFGFGTVFNAGVDGELTTDGVGRIDNAIVGQDPDVILIMEGTNDVVNGIDVGVTAFNLRRMVQRSFEEKATILPFLAQIPPRLDPGPEGFDGSFSDEIDALNAMLPSIAQQEGATIVDQHTPIDGQPMLMSNPLHPSVAGYQVMADTWYDEIKPVALSLTNRGDVDASGRTDGLDLVLLALAFGAIDGEARYSADADINQDGIVDGFDLSILIEFFGIVVTPTP